MEKFLTEIDLYTVQSPAVLGNEDRNIISKLYQPIIGCGAAMLYFSLWSELERNKTFSIATTHKRICAIMGITIYVFEDYRRKLEAIGLLKSYVKQKDVQDFVYELQSPLSPKNFFKNPLLSGELLKAMGQMGYEKTLYFFSAPTVDPSYASITKTYDEVFMSKNYNNAPVGEIRERKSTAPTLKFDFTQFASLLKDVNLSADILTEETKEYIAGIASLYNLDLFEMRSVLAKSVSKDKIPPQAEHEAISKNAKALYNNKSTAQQLELVYKATPKVNISKSTPVSTLEIKIRDMETLTPFEYLKNLQGSEPIASDLTIIESILINQKITPGVVNAIVDFAVSKNDGRLVKEYVEKLAASLKRAKITKAKEAFESLTKPPKTRKKQDVGMPEWYNATTDDIVGTDEDYDDELSKLSERMKNV